MKKISPIFLSKHFSIYIICYLIHFLTFFLFHAPPHLLLIFYLYSQSSIRLRNGINKSDLNFHLNLKNVVKKFLSFLNLIFYANPHFFIPIHIFLFCFLSNWLIFNVKYCFCPLFAQNRRKSIIFLNFFREPKKIKINVEM